MSVFCLCVVRLDSLLPTTIFLSVIGAVTLMAPITIGLWRFVLSVFTCGKVSHFERWKSVNAALNETIWVNNLLTVGLKEPAHQQFSVKVMRSLKELLYIQMWVYFAMYRTSGLMTSHPLGVLFYCSTLTLAGPAVKPGTPRSYCFTEHQAVNPAKTLNVIWRNWKRHIGKKTANCLLLWSMDVQYHCLCAEAALLLFSVSG